MPSGNISITLVAIAKHHCPLTGVYSYVAECSMYCGTIGILPGTRKFEEYYSWQLHTKACKDKFGNSSPVQSSPAQSSD